MKKIDDRLTVHMPKSMREKIQRLAERKGTTASSEALRRLEESFKRQPKPKASATPAA